MGIILLQCLAFGGIIVYAVLTLVRQLVSPLRSIPGPLLARFTDLWYLVKIRRGDFELTNKRLHEQYGMWKLSNWITQ